MQIGEPSEIKMRDISIIRVLLYMHMYFSGNYTCQHIVYPLIYKEHNGVDDNDNGQMAALAVILNQGRELLQGELLERIR